MRDLSAFVLGFGGLIAFIVAASWLANGNGFVALLLVLLGFMTLVAYSALRTRKS